MLSIVSPVPSGMLAAMSSAIAVSSAPEAALVSRSTASPTAVTSTATSAVVTVPSVEVAVTPSVKSSFESSGGVTVRPSSWSAVTV